MTRRTCYLLLLTGEREYGETVFPSSSGRALFVLTEYYEDKKTISGTQGTVLMNYYVKRHVKCFYTKKAPLGRC